MVGEMETFCAMAAAGSRATASATAKTRNTGGDIDDSCMDPGSGHAVGATGSSVGRAQPPRILTRLLEAHDFEPRVLVALDLALLEGQLTPAAQELLDRRQPSGPVHLRRG